MAAGVLHGQASDLAVLIQGNPAGALARRECQREFHQGVLAELAGRRLAHALEAAGGAGRLCPPVGDAAGVHVTADVLVEFPACLLPAALDEVAEQCTCPVRGTGRDIGHGRSPPSCGRILAAASSTAEWVSARMSSE